LGHKITHLPLVIKKTIHLFYFSLTSARLGPRTLASTAAVPATSSAREIPRTRQAPPRVSLAGRRQAPPIAASLGGRERAPATSSTREIHWAPAHPCAATYTRELLLTIKLHRARASLIAGSGSRTLGRRDPAAAAQSDALLAVALRSPRPIRSARRVLVTKEVRRERRGKEEGRKVKEDVFCL
jgi:hypothetical protein